VLLFNLVYGNRDQRLAGVDIQQCHEAERYLNEAIKQAGIPRQCVNISAMFTIEWGRLSRLERRGPMHCSFDFGCAVDDDQIEDVGRLEEVIR